MRAAGRAYVPRITAATSRGLRTAGSQDAEQGRTAGQLIEPPCDVTIIIFNKEEKI
jgi:hypothetical protein